MAHLSGKLQLPPGTANRQSGTLAPARWYSLSVQMVLSHRYLQPAIWEAYWSWLETVNPASGSHLAKAVTYAKNQKPYMENYLLDVRCSISNNITRPYAVGRKNFLFHDTIKGARASSIIYSLVETAKLNNLNIYAYLETVLLYMSDYKNEPEGIEELMPWSEMIQQRCRIKLK